MNKEKKATQEPPAQQERPEQPVNPAQKALTEHQAQEEPTAPHGTAVKALHHLGLGAVGSYYLDKTTNDVYTKVGMGTWEKQSNLEVNNSADYNSGWVDISKLAGQNFTLAHNLNSTDLIVQLEGMDSHGNIHQRYLGLESSTILGWTQTYGESFSYYPLSMANASDGGYVITGAVEEVGIEGYTVFLLKTDSYGYIEWSRTYDLPNYNVGYCVVETSDGGYAITGSALSTIYEAETALLLKTNSTGFLEWNQTYGEDYSYGRWLIQTSDHGYAIAGVANTGMYLVKTSSDGTLVWNKTYGGQTAYSVVQTSDGGYALAGTINNETTWESDVYFVKTNSAGIMEWNRTYGGGRL